MTVQFKRVSDEASKALGNAMESKGDSRDPLPCSWGLLAAECWGHRHEQLRQRNSQLRGPPSICKMIQVQKLGKG